MKKILLIIALLVASGPVRAQQSLTDQIEAMRTVQDQNQAAQQSAQQATERRMAQQRAAEKALEEKRAAAAADLQQQKEAAAEANEKRDQSYEDQLRALDLQQKQLELEARKARVARENDYIDQELKTQAAETDVIKSQADATRDLSSGTKTLLEKTGEAEVKSQLGK